MTAQSLSAILCRVIDDVPKDFDSLNYLKDRHKEYVLRDKNKLDALDCPDTSPQKRLENFCKAAKLAFIGDKVVHTIGNTEKSYRSKWNAHLHKPFATIEIKHIIAAAVAIKLIERFKVPFAILARGRMPNPGFNSVNEQGIVLDISEMKHLTIQKESCTIGAGKMWYTTQEALYERRSINRCAAIGGRDWGLCAGGLLLAGGMPYFPNSWGMACDNVKEFVVVCGDASVKVANEGTNPDLFKALKGGGANFGLVTHFTLKTHTDILLNQWVLRFDNEEEGFVADTFAKLSKAMEADDSLGAELQILDVGSRIFLWQRGGNRYTGNKYIPTAFREFIMGPSSRTKDTPKVFNEIIRASEKKKGEVTRDCNQPLAHHIPEWGDEIANCAFGTLTVRNNANTYKAMIKQFRSAEPMGDIVAMHFQPLAASCVKKSKDIGGNMLNLAAETQSIIRIVTMWARDTTGEDVRVKMPQWIESLQKAAGKDLLPTLHMNDAWMGQDVLGSYGEKNVEFMRGVSKKYDPEQVFQNLQHDGFLLSRMPKKGE